MTLYAVKGLEAQNVVIHNFGSFIKNNFKHENEIVYRQIYVLLTRAQENIYLSIGNTEELSNDPRAKFVYETLKDAALQHAKQADLPQNDKKEDNTHKLKLSKLRPVLTDVKEGTELVVAASELFAIIGGLFAM